MVGMLSILGACAKDPASELSSHKKTMSFEVLTDNDWLPLLQNSNDAGEHPTRPAGVFALQGENPADTLFLHAMISCDQALSEEDSAQTRAMPIEQDQFYDSFGVLSSMFANAWDEDVCEPDYMFNVEVTKESNWTTSYLWPGGDNKVRFFAYAPYNGQGVQLSDANTPGTPTITYTVPAAVEDQQDLLVATTGDVAGDTAADVPLTFKHVLTAVKFVSGEDMLKGSISKITLKGVYGSAVYTMGAEAWTQYGEAVDFSQELAVDMDGSADQEITAQEATFMMLPQTLADGASIEVVYTDKLSSTQRTLVAQIGGTEWPMGEVVTYRISTTSINITPVLNIVSPNPFSYYGGTGQLMLNSYATVSRVGDATKQVPLSWTAECVQDNGDGTYTPIERPAWLAVFPWEGQGSIGPSRHVLSVDAQTKQIVYPHDEALKQATPLGSDDARYSLDTKGGTTAQNTANCYVINAPGKYKFPLVYGNAIKDGKLNAEAFTPVASGSNVLNPFICLGGHGTLTLPEKIISPYIYENEYTYPSENTPNAVEVEWQDVENLVTNTQLSEDGKWVYFDVDAATIKQGNALIALASQYDADGSMTRVTLWTWHIWVTDYELGEDVKSVNSNGSTYQFLPVNLGWCNGPTHDYAARSVLVRFTQAETGASKVITISQMPYAYEDPGTSLYYQWGRVIPTVAANTGFADAEDKTVYMKFRAPDGSVLDWIVPISTLLTFDSRSVSTAPGAAIYVGFSSPFGFNVNPDMDGLYANLWSGNNSTWNAADAKAVKTVYDPCPAGYQVPVSNAFGAFVTPNTTEKSENGGVYFDCTNGLIYFPALGLRNVTNDGILESIETSGNYWTASPYDATNGVAFKCTTAGGSLSNAKRGYGYSLRPMQEVE